MDRQWELSEIDQWIAQKGVSRCKPAFVAPTSIALPDEKQRLAEMTLKPSLGLTDIARLRRERLKRQATRHQSQPA